MSNRSRATSSAWASWTAKRTRRRCSLVSVLRAAATFIGARIEGIHGRCAGRGERGQSSLAAADFEHALALEWNQRGDRRRLDPVLVAPLHSLAHRLVGLDGGAAGAELLRFPARVFEIGASVGIDELAGLDPLEAVTF